MDLTGIFRAFSVMLCITGISMAVPCLFAAGGQGSGPEPFVYGMAITLATGMAAFAASAGKRPPSGFRSALITVLLYWTVIPAFAALPFFMDGMSFPDAYFEATAAITTTGGWLSRSDALENLPFMIWRALLQWTGGLASIAIAASIFIRPALTGTETALPPFPRGETASFLGPLQNAVTGFSAVYAAMTLAAFITFILCRAPAADSLIMAMSITASGGYIPHADGISAYGSTFIIAATPYIILGGSNFVLLTLFVYGRHRYYHDRENRNYAGILACVATLFFFLTGGGGTGAFAQQFFNAASLMSTNGFITGKTPPLAAMMVTVLIGGTAVSTAGGFKVLRWTVIMNRTRQEIIGLVSPRYVSGRQKISGELGIWMHFIAFTLVLAALVIILSAGEYPLPVAVTTASAALSNTGPLVYILPESTGGYAVFDGFFRWILAGAMILGRIEAVFALAFFNAAFWRF